MASESAAYPDVEHPEPRPAGTEPVGELSAGELRRDDIGHEKVDRPSLAPGQLQGLPATPRRENVVAETGERAERQFAHLGLVLGEQNRLTPLRRMLAPCRFEPVAEGALHQQKPRESDQNRGEHEVPGHEQLEPHRVYPSPEEPGGGPFERRATLRRRGPGRVAEDFLKRDPAGDQGSNRRTARVTLWPPNPNELESATSTVRSTIWLGAQSRSHWGSGLV